jgi:3-oxoadipate enol-lactonase
LINGEQFILKATINNRLVNYIEAGTPTAAPLVFIHGFPFSHRMWTFEGGQTNYFSNSNRVIAYDVCGHGDSEVGDGQYTIEFFVDDFIGLLDHLNIAHAVVVGLSMGGYIALRAIERNPERFKGLVLCDTQSAADSNETKLKRAASIKSIKANGPRAYAQSFVPNVFAAESFSSKPEAVKMIQSIIECTAPLALCGTLLALASRTDTSAALANINVPTLIMVGEHDALTPPPASEAMREKIHGSELHVIRSAAHMSNLENPAEFNAHLAEFLKKISS